MPKHWQIASLALLIGAAGGWALRGSQKVVEYRERVVSVEASRDSEGKSEQRTVNVTRIERPTVRVVTRTIRVPDGTITTEQERHETGGATDTKVEAEIRIEYRDREKLVYRDRQVERIERPALPTWGVSVQAGAALVEPLIVLPGVSRGLLGVTVERRLFGPVNAGVWVSSVGAGGVSVGARW
jgi:hypothetical protein